MKFHRTLIVCLALIVVGVLTPSSARADGQDRKTIVTFREPFRVPGRSLPAGNYVFRIADVDSSPHVVQIFDAHEKQLIATLLAVPDYLTKPAEQAEFLLDHRSETTPESLREWLYPGDTVAEAFIYPRVRPEQVARAQN